MIASTHSPDLTTSTDNHTITMKVKRCVPVETVKKTIIETLNRNPHAANYNKGFKMSVVSVKGVPTGRYYFFFYQPEIYHMILGRNVDGTARVEKYSDPDWSPPLILESNEPKSWADIMDEEDEMVAPILERQLPSLIPLPKIKLTPEQQEQQKLYDAEDRKRKAERRRENGEEVTEDDLIEEDPEPELASFKIEPAQAHTARDGNCHNVLRSSNLPAFMDEKYLYNEFKVFSSSKNKYFQRYGKGKDQVKEVPYPAITIVSTAPNNKYKDRNSYNNQGKKERIAYITFDSATTDASFAFHLMRNQQYIGPKGEKCIVQFTYAKDRGCK